MIRETEINDLNIFNSLSLPDEGGGALEVLPLLLLLEHDHNILRLEVPVHDLQLVEVHDSLHDVANDECAFELVQVFAFLDVLVQVLPVNVLSDDVFVSFTVNCVHIFHYLRMV